MSPSKDRVPDGIPSTADGDQAPVEVSVPRGIIRWIKWRQAALRAECREVKRRKRESTNSRSSEISEPVLSPEASASETSRISLGSI
jgi:hypothetical protein